MAISISVVVVAVIMWREIDFGPEETVRMPLVFTPMKNELPRL
jgi:hypothetical protein